MRRAVQFPPRSSKPLIAQRSLGIGASDKSLYSALGLSPNLRLLHFHAFLECRPCRHGAKQKHRVMVQDEVTCLTALFGLHVQRSVPHCLPCIVNCGFSGCKDRSISFPISENCPPNYRYYQLSAGSSDVRLKGYSATCEDSPDHMQSAYMN